MSDVQILAYVRTDNYCDADGGISLRRRLTDLPAGWDFDGDGIWTGYFPDSRFDFDAEGFDLNPDGTLTGWRAYAYTPFLGTFWPTNGATDDVLLRLVEPFRRNVDGNFDRTVYKINLAIVEALMRRADVPIEPADEHVLGADIDRDGNLGMAERVSYDWDSQQGRRMTYVGQAGVMQRRNELHLAAGLFPEGTEFLHSVRYIDVRDDDRIALAARMKELRYARKVGWLSYHDLRDAAAGEAAETHSFPDRLREVYGNVEAGVSNDHGWIYQGFIEAADGELRSQTYEETVFCVGCHSTIGATTDGVLSFPRRLGAQAYQGGWYHWSQQGLAGIPEPLRADGQYEYTHYLMQNGAGDEFRANTEVLERLFDSAGRVRAEPVETLHQDIGTLLYPSRRRALELNKAYKVIVDRQTYVYGRDATVTAPQEVYREVQQGEPTGISTPVAGPRRAARHRGARDKNKKSSAATLLRPSGTSFSVGS